MDRGPGKPAGAKRHRIVIEAPPEPQGQDGFGDPRDDWSVVAETWACVEALGGQRLIAAQSLAAEASYEVTLWWRPGVNPRMRVQWEGRTLNVLSTKNPDGMKVDLVLTCSEEVLN